MQPEKDLDMALVYFITIAYDYGLEKTRSHRQVTGQQSSKQFFSTCNKLNIDFFDHEDVLVKKGE